MKKFTNELKIGIFILLAIGAGSIFWMKTHKIKPSDTYQLKTSFNYAGGIRPNSIVSLSGIEVGKVDTVTFVYDKGTKIELVLSLLKSAKVRTDSIAYISTSGFIGDAFIGITSGTPDAAFVEPGSTVPSEDPIELRELMKKADSIAKNLDAALGELKGLGKTIDETGKSIQGAMNEVGELAKNLNGTVSDNKQKINNIIANLESTSVNFTEFSDDIKKHPWKLLMKGKE
ncbi:MAG: MlaD family protein [Candidatus Omnitrophica bacterium]|nr:MlaD family protein [Candidatus Omnitrophota bacterium]